MQIKIFWYWSIFAFLGNSNMLQEQNKQKQQQLSINTINSFLNKFENQINYQVRQTLTLSNPNQYFDWKKDIKSNKRRLFGKQINYEVRQ